MKNPTEEGKMAARALTSGYNGCCDREFTKGFLEELSKTHRTLQQRYGTLLIESILFFASLNDNNWTDARNEAICKLSSKLRDVCRAENATYTRGDTEQASLPFI
jgi:hypothetical protein